MKQTLTNVSPIYKYEFTLLIYAKKQNGVSKETSNKMIC
jgi:hypothetical protein